MGKVCRIRWHIFRINEKWKSPKLGEFSFQKKTAKTYAFTIINALISTNMSTKQIGCFCNLFPWDTVITQIIKCSNKLHVMIKIPWRHAIFQNDKHIVEQKGFQLTWFKVALSLVKWTSGASEHTTEVWLMSAVRRQCLSTRTEKTVHSCISHQTTMIKVSFKQLIAPCITSRATPQTTSGIIPDRTVGPLAPKTGSCFCNAAWAYFF